MNIFSKLSAVVFLIGFSTQVTLAQTGNDNPTGPSGAFAGNGIVTTAGVYSPYTANGGPCSITDIVVPGGVATYPLSFVRTLNTRAVAGLGSEFGLSGNWRHNYQWSIDSQMSMTPTPDTMPSSYTVNYPDGRRVTFTQSTSDSDPYMRGGPGVPERFRRPNSTDRDCYLFLPDGGRVWFKIYIERLTDEATGRTTSFYDFSFEGIIDPYGQITTVTYPEDRSMTITEPAGRWLKLFYTQTPWQNGGQHDTVLDRVESSDGRSVKYNYGQYSTSNSPQTIPEDGVTYTFLGNVVYYGDENLVAEYTYQADNVDPDGRPLIRTCSDPMFPGMKRIAYAFLPGSQGGVYGQLEREMHFDGTPVSILSGTLGDIRRETRGDGPSRTFTYEGARLVSWTDFKGVSASQGRDTAGHVNSLTNFNGSTTDYTRHPWTGLVETLTHPLTPSENGTRATMQYVYANPAFPNPSNPYYLHTVTNERGKTATYGRDDNDRVTRIDHPDGAHETFDYNGFGQVISHRMRSGGTETFIYYDAFEFGGVLNGQLKEYRDPYSPPDRPTRAYTYYSAAPHIGRVESVTDTRGNRTDYAYNLRGQVTRITHPPAEAGAPRYSVEYLYNPDGTLQSVRDENWNPANPQAHSTTYLYDDYKRVLRATDGRGKTTFYDYTRFGTSSSLRHTNSFVFRQTSPLGKLVDQDCDDNFRAVLRRAAPGSADEASTTYEYDNVGNLTGLLEPRKQPGQPHQGSKTQFAYDQRNRRTSATDALTRSTLWSYDPASNKLREDRPDGGVTTWEEYDPMNRLKQMTVARDGDVLNNVVTRMSYEDEARNLTSMTDPRGKTYRYVYDLLNRKTSATYPADSLGAVRSEGWVYDTVGNLRFFTNRAGASQDFTYDGRNRETRFDWNDGTTSYRAIGYDPASNILNVTNSSGAVDFTYDEDNRLLSDKQGAHTVTYTYDTDGNRGSLNYPHGSSHSYLYTLRNQLKNMHVTGNPGAPFLQYSYDASGNRTERLLANGTRTDYSAADALNRISGLQHSFAGGVTQRFDYDFDALNRRKYEMRNANPDETDGYAYDLTSQLKGFNRNGALQGDGTVTGGANVVTLNYDHNGNRTTVVDNGAANPYAANDLSQYTSDNSGGMTYDPNGNLTARAGWTYTYDAQNRLTAADDFAANIHVRYSYDGLNRQIGHDITGASTVSRRNVWDGWRLIEERDAAANLVYTYTHGAGTDELLQRNTPANAQLWYHQDGRGNTSHLSDGAGNLVERYTYDLAGKPYFYSGAGQQIGVSAYSNRFLFQGREWSPQSGLYDFRNRFYHPELNRFLQPDPISFDGDATNLYRFVGNDPVNSRDPSGLDRVITYQTETGGVGFTVFGDSVETADSAGHGSRRGGSSLDFSGGQAGEGSTGDGGAGSGKNGDGNKEGKEEPEKTKEPCPEVPPAPPGANLNANIQQMLREPQRAATSGGDAFAGGQGLGRVSGFIGAVMPGGSWDYKTQNPAGSERYTAFGNFNYGATGAAAGFSPGTLLRGAGFVQAHFGNAPGDGGSVTFGNVMTGRGGQSPYQDQIQDQVQIILGILYYLADCY